MVGISGEQAKEAFMTGKAAMFFTGPWEYNNFKEALPHDRYCFPHFHQ